MRPGSQGDKSERFQASCASRASSPSRLCLLIGRQFHEEKPERQRPIDHGVERSDWTVRLHFLFLCGPKATRQKKVKESRSVCNFWALRSAFLSSQFCHLRASLRKISRLQVRDRIGQESRSYSHGLQARGTRTFHIFLSRPPKTVIP